MKLSELENRDLFNYMLFYNKMTVEEKNKINFVVYKNHLMYLKENNTEKYNYYYTFLEKMLYDINTSFDKERNIEINSINDIVILFNNIMKIKNDFFESSLELNNILTNNGLCPLVLYAFNNIIYKVPVTENDIKKIIEFSLMCLYRVVTFKNSKNAQEIAEMVPNDRMLIETDSPYLAPEPVRGTRNDSRNVRYIAEKIANIKSLSTEEIAEITYQNTLKIFKI